MSFRNRVFFCTFLLLVLSASPVLSRDAESLSSDEAYFLIDNLVGLSEFKSDHKLQLANYRRWEELQNKFLKKEDNLTMEDMKIILLMIFIAEERAKVHPSEELARHIGPLFVKKSDMILDILKDLPFLIQATCNSLNDHFSLHQDKKAKEIFLKENKKKIVESLGKLRATKCLNAFAN